MPKPPTTPGKPGKYKPETVVDPMVNGITILGILRNSTLHKPTTSETGGFTG